MTEAISHVLAQLPVSEIQNALQIFCLPVIQQLHELVTKAQSGVSVTDDVKSYVKIGGTCFFSIKIYRQYIILYSL